MIVLDGDWCMSNGGVGSVYDSRELHSSRYALDDRKLWICVCLRLAILIMAVDHYCVNSGHLLGEYAMRRRHLRKLGYTVVEVCWCLFQICHNIFIILAVFIRISKK